MASKTVKQIHLHRAPLTGAFHAVLALLFAFNIWAPSLDQIAAIEGVLAFLATAVHYGPDPA